MAKELTNGEADIRELVKHELSDLRKEWWYFLLIGILLVIGGTAAIAYPWFTSVGVVIFLGAVLIVSGLATIISAFWIGKWSAFMVQLLIGILYMVAGFVITEAPLVSLTFLTLMLAGFFVIAGGFRIVTALVEKYPQWGWSLVNGIVTLLLGLIIFRSFKQLPEEENGLGVLWIIGLMVGLELLFNGWTWIMLSFAVKNLPEVEETPA